MAVIQIRLNQDLPTPFGDRKSGTELEIATDEYGVPLLRFWRDRLKDSDVDNCVTILNSTEQKPEKNNKTLNQPTKSIENEQ